MLHLTYFQACKVALLLWSLLLAPACATRGQSAAQSPSIDQLHADYAMRFMEPAPHMALAKYFRDKGNRIQAYYILENARRYRFEEDEFNKAFALSFKGEQPPDYSQAAEVSLLNKHASDPDSVETLVKLADVYISRKDWTKAKEYIAKAIRLEPDDFAHTDGLAQVFRLEGNVAESDRLIKEFAQKFPETQDGYRLRLAEVSEKEPEKAKSLAAAAMKKFPREGGFVFGMATILQREGKLPEAEQYFVKAAEMSPDSAHIQAWVGRFFYKVKKDDQRALHYYLNAYLLDPHAYETEFVESRIPITNGAVTKAAYEQQRKNGVPLAKIAADPNPGMAYNVFEEMTKWDPSYKQICLDLMDHEDSAVRWYAMLILMEKVDRSFDETLKALLKDKDLRKRGLAAYMAVHLWKQESFGLMRAMLKEESQLLRFDAVSALVMEGGPEGRAIVVEHLANEKHPQLRKLIEAVIKRPPE